MRPASALKQDLEVVRTLGDLIDVLKTTAIIQFRAFQRKQKTNRNFFNEIEDCFRLLLTKKVVHPYLFDRQALPAAILVVTSDEGFLGELNTMLINTALDQKRQRQDEIIVMGERGARYLEDMLENFKFFPGISDQMNYSEAESIRDYLIEGYHKRFGRVLIVYPEFISLASQKVSLFRLLPWSEVSYEKEKAVSGSLATELLIEPDPYRVLETMIGLWTAFKLQGIFWSSKQAEFAARIMHLEASTQEISQMTQKFSLEYFRQVHALKDKVIREISASKILLSKR